MSATADLWAERTSSAFPPGRSVAPSARRSAGSSASSGNGAFRVRVTGRRADSPFRAQEGDGPSCERLREVVEAMRARPPAGGQTAGRRGARVWP